MKIINEDFNECLVAASRIPIVGFATGPARVALAVAQVALNLLAALPSLIASCIGLDEKHWFHFNQIGGDFSEGIDHIARGVLEFLPGSSFHFATEVTVVTGVTPNGTHVYTDPDAILATGQGSKPWAELA